MLPALAQQTICLCVVCTLWFYCTGWTATFTRQPHLTEGNVHAGINWKQFVSQGFGSQCNAVSTCEWFLMFWRHYVPLKHHKPLTQWFNVTSRKTWILSNSTVRMSYLAVCSLYELCAQFSRLVSTFCPVDICFADGVCVHITTGCVCGWVGSKYGECSS
jgi:hypothetical protein